MFSNIFESQNTDWYMYILTKKLKDSHLYGYYCEYWEIELANPQTRWHFFLFTADIQVV